LRTHAAAVAEATAIYREGRHFDPAMWERLKEEFIQTYRNKIGLCCLTEQCNNILMWSHYADNHKGYCVEFEATDHTLVFGRAQRVSYSDVYPEINFYNTPGDEKVRLTFLTKFTDWQYEREWRILNHDEGPGLQHYPVE